MQRQKYIEATLDSMILHPRSPHISSARIEPGHYYATSPDHQASIDLGHCASPGELFETIREIISIGGDDCDWTDWYLSVY